MNPTPGHAAAAATGLLAAAIDSVTAVYQACLRQSKALAEGR